MEELLDIDELLKDDSFIETALFDEDISKILQEWKDSDTNILPTATTSSNINSTKFIDTRTFTRPKKRLNDIFATHAEHNVSLNKINETVTTPSSTNKINYQVGGPVLSTSFMQKSWLNDVSPPTSFNSSIDSMHDGMISKTDINSIEEHNSGTNTPIIPIDNSSSDASTIIEAKNIDLTSKFDSFNGDSFIINNENISSNNIVNSTYNMGNNNSTFEKLTLKNSYNESVNSIDDKIRDVTYNKIRDDTYDNIQNITYNKIQDGTFDKVQDQTYEKNVDETYDKIENITYGNVQDLTFEKYENCTFNKTTDKTFNKINNQTYDGINNDTYDRIEYTKSNLFESPPVSNIGKYQINKQFAVTQSTPTSTVNKENINDIDLSPILLYRRQSVQHNAAESDNHVERLNKNNLEKYMDENHVSDKRLSLQTFEYFEKSISLLDEKKDEREFDEILNSFTENIKSTESEKLRQSLDNIKKRHSLLNMEKQQEDLMRKIEYGNSGDSVNTSNYVDNKVIDSLNKLGSGLMSTSHGGSIERLLNRRSRICDDQTILPVAEQNEELVDNSSNTEESSNNVSGSKLDKKNRDRFKTIRISKRWEQGMIDIATEVNDAEQSSNNQFSELPPQQSEEVPIDEAVFKTPEPLQKPSKLRSLSKPKYYSSNISKKDLSLPISQISNSNDNLESRPSTSVPTLKSPMGIKSKSYHNLSSNKLITNLRLPSKLGSSASKLTLNPKSSNEHNNYGSSLSKQNSSQYNTKPSFSATDNKVLDDRNKLSGVPTMRSNILKRPGLVRPSSGYYNYNNPKRNDSDTESGRYSPNSLSSSSASSRGSLYRIDNSVQNLISKTDSESNSVEDISLMNVQRNIGDPTVREQPKSIKPSGLRQPSNLRPPTAKSGLPKPMSYGKR